ncbi:MAG: DNA repair protein RadC [Clostridiaceae bacterium]|nr:DNA repair protein RadC [Clostridiaceae bacterium]
MAQGHRERIINKALKYGIESFQKHEVLELYLFTLIPRVDTNPIAHELIRVFGSFYNVCNAPVEELLKIKGIGRRTAQQLKLFPSVARAYLLSMYGDKKLFSSVDDIGRYCVDLFCGRINEAMYLLCLDTNKAIIKQVLVAEGTPSQVFIEPRQIIEHVTYSSTHSVILCHNHPGGTLLPSQQDIEATQRIKAALDTIGIELLDHIIVGKGSFISFYEHNFRF